MRRLGHASPAAALIYQHAVDDRDADIARALDDVIAAAPVVPIRAAKRSRAAPATERLRGRSAN